MTPARTLIDRPRTIERAAGQQATGVPSAIVYCDRLSNSYGISPRVGCANMT